MRKYKVNRTEPVKKPSKEAMEKYKNFSRLTHEYDKLVKKPKKPIYLDKKMLLIVLLIAIVAMIISQVIDEEDKENEDKKNDTGWLIPNSSDSESLFES